MKNVKKKYLSASKWLHEKKENIERDRKRKIERRRYRTRERERDCEKERERYINIIHKPGTDVHDGVQYGLEHVETVEDLHYPASKGLQLCTVVVFQHLQRSFLFFPFKHLKEIF